MVHETKEFQVCAYSLFGNDVLFSGVRFYLGLYGIRVKNYFVYVAKIEGTISWAKATTTMMPNTA